MGDPKADLGRAVPRGFPYRYVPPDLVGGDWNHGIYCSIQLGIMEYNCVFNGI